MTFNKQVFVAACVVTAGLANADVVERVWWNPRIGHDGASDPFQGQTTDDTLANPGDLIANGLGRYGSNGTIGFSNLPDAFSEDHYIEFSLRPGAGTALEVHDLILQGANATTGQGAPLSNMILRTEADGFSTDIIAQAGPTGLQGNTGRPVLFDLEHLSAFDDEFTFRLYVWGMGGNFGIVGSIATRGYGMWFGDVDANPVPAPAACLVLGMGGVVSMRRRR